MTNDKDYVPLSVHIHTYPIIVNAHVYVVNNAQVSEQ